jgi:hypothetical protein
MDRTEWLERLTRMFGQHPDVAKHVESLASKLGDVPDTRFTEASLGGVFKSLRSAVSASRIETALDKWWLAQGVAPAPKTPRPKPIDTVLEERAKLDARHEELRRDWSNAATIRHAVAICESNSMLLALLRGIVGRWAPAYADLVPPPAGGLLDWNES